MAAINAGRDSKLYARRNVVEPQMGPVEDPDAEYTTKLVVVTHKVRKGETLSTIAHYDGHIILSHATICCPRS